VINLIGNDEHLITGVQEEKEKELTQLTIKKRELYWLELRETSRKQITTINKEKKENKNYVQGIQQ